MRLVCLRTFTHLHKEVNLRLYNPALFVFSFHYYYFLLSTVGIQLQMNAGAQSLRLPMYDQNNIIKPKMDVLKKGSWD